MELIFTVCFIIFFLFICWRMYSEMDYFQLKCILCDKNGETYCVRDRGTLQKTREAVNLLAGCVEKCKKLVDHLKRTMPDDTRVVRLVKGFKPEKVTETLPTSTLTAYSENKGEKLAICLNKKKEGKKLIDENTLFFVALHELSHIATESIGHKDEFWLNFKFLLEQAKDIGIYEPVDFKQTPQDFCGIKIEDNPFYDV